MSVFSGRKLGVELCDALGLDKNKIISLTLTCSLDHAATVDAEMLVDSNVDLSTVLKRYVVVERES